MAVPYPSLILCGFLACITINAGVCGKFAASDVPFSVGQCHKNNINAYLTVNFLSTRTPCHIRDRPLAVIIAQKFEQRLRFGVQLLFSRGVRTSVFFFSLTESRINRTWRRDLRDCEISFSNFIGINLPTPVNFNTSTRYLDARDPRESISEICVKRYDKITVIFIRKIELHKIESCCSIYFFFSNDAYK